MRERVIAAWCSPVGRTWRVRLGSIMKPDAARHAPNYPAELVDSYDNLLLLCRVHHKMVDDQPDTYTVELRGQLRAYPDR